jgi:hypothetical protein
MPLNLKRSAPDTPLMRFAITSSRRESAGPASNRLNPEIRAEGRYGSERSRLISVMVVHVCADPFTMCGTLC